MAVAVAVAMAAPSPFLGHILPRLRKSRCEQCIQNSVKNFRIMALFLGLKKTVEPSEMNHSLRDFMSAELHSEGDPAKPEKAKRASVSVVSSISEFQVS